MNEDGLATAVANFVKNLVDRVDDEEREIRFSTCKQCPDLNALDTCRHCGCFMRAKTYLKDSKCPIDKW
jgi:hypothetical protein